MLRFKVVRAFLINAAFCLLALPLAQAQPADAAAAAASAAERHAQAAAKSATAAASAASAAIERAWVAPGSTALYAVPAVVLVASLFAVLSVRGALMQTNWSLADALSEEAQVSYFKETTEEKDGKKTTTKELVKDTEGKAVQVTEMRASTSRVIALMGMMVIVFLFLGFGVFALFSFGATGVLPDSIDRVVSFLVAGMTLFAPYIVNKFSSLFSGLSGSKN